MVNEKEMVDMNEIIRIQKEYDVRIFNTPLVDFNMTLGEYWDRFRFGNPNDEYCDLMDKREEIPENSAEMGVSSFTKKTMLPAKSRAISSARAFARLLGIISAKR